MGFRIKGYKYKTPTLSGKRMPIEYDIEAKYLQREANKIGKKLSYQDALRNIFRKYKGKK